MVLLGVSSHHPVLFFLVTVTKHPTEANEGKRDRSSQRRSQGRRGLRLVTLSAQSGDRKGHLRAGAQFAFPIVHSLATLAQETGPIKIKLSLPLSIEAAKLNLQVYPEPASLSESIFSQTDN